MASLDPIRVVGGGLAGSEAAWQLAQAGVPVVLNEMRTAERRTEAHHTDQLAELVCSNSFRSDDPQTNAVGLLHAEMRLAGSLIMATADEHQVPAGGALAVDREGFAQAVTTAIHSHPQITVERDEVTALPAGEAAVLIATGPLTSAPLAEAIRASTGRDALAFFDAIAPIVHRDSIDMDVAWMQSRYDKGETEADKAAYINCPMNEAEYNDFIDALINGPKTEFKNWEKDTPYFNGCLPIEVMAERGRETLRHGPMKPRGLTNAHQPDVKPYAVVQLRQDNRLGTLFNMVGFQTKLKYAAQAEVFRMIPGLHDAQFARLGGVHRNTFIDSPQVLDPLLRLKSRPNVRFAGQITGVEGYVESAAIGLLAGRFMAAEHLGQAPLAPPPTTALGGLLAHITGGHLAGGGGFQPMNVNFGLFPPVEAPTRDADGKRLRGAEKAKARKRAWTSRALADCRTWLAAEPHIVVEAAE